MSTMLEQHDYPDNKNLADALADIVSLKLRQGIYTRGRALLAVSGGSTPRQFLTRLGEAEIDWGRVTVTLVDDRWVDETSDRSNGRLIRETLLQGPGAAAKFRPLYTGERSPEKGLVRGARLIANLARPFDVVVLGMGADGHTASFFPGGDKLAEAIDPNTPASLLPMRAPGAGEPRVTMTLPVILGTRFLALHIEGEEKAVVLGVAQSDGPEAVMPVRAVLRQDKVPVNVYWCP